MCDAEFACEGECVLWRLGDASAGASLEASATMGEIWYGYSVTPPLFLLLPLLLGLFVPVTACCWPLGFPRQGDPFLLSPPPPPSPRELGLDPSRCPEPWICEFVAAQLDVCPTEGLPWLALGGPWLGLGVGV